MREMLDISLKNKCDNPKNCAKITVEAIKLIQKEIGFFRDTQETEEAAIQWELNK